MTGYILALAIQSKILFEKPTVRDTRYERRRKLIEHKKLLIRAAAQSR